jgi:hypothetical protein
MRPNGVRPPENLLFPDGMLKPELDALRIAQARQDLSHRKLDRWIAATIAELRDKGAPHHPSPSSTAKTRGGKIGRL